MELQRILSIFNSFSFDHVVVIFQNHDEIERSLHYCLLSHEISSISYVIYSKFITMKTFVLPFLLAFLQNYLVTIYVLSEVCLVFLTSKAGELRTVFRLDIYLFHSCEGNGEKLLKNISQSIDFCSLSLSCALLN